MGGGLRAWTEADTVDCVTFTGWPASALEFYAGLEADNSKAYWTEHKRVYDEDVLAPMNALLDELAEEFGSGKIFRPFRDIRFSADKSPYKTTIAARLERGGFVQLSAQGLDVGAGCHGLASDQLERYREAVDDEDSGEALQRLIAELEGQGMSVDARERLKGTPRGYPEDHPRAQLLRNKDIVARKLWPDADWLHTAAARTRIVDALRLVRPLDDWIATNVGESASARRR